MLDLNVGSIVRSVAGRDAKRIFVVISVEEDSGENGGYVWIADGKLRKIETPKRKKLRHLRFLSPADRELGEMLRGGSLTNTLRHAYLTRFETTTSDA